MKTCVLLTNLTSGDFVLRAEDVIKKRHKLLPRWTGPLLTNLLGINLIRGPLEVAPVSELSGPKRILTVLYTLHASRIIPVARLMSQKSF